MDQRKTFPFVEGGRLGVRAVDSSYDELTFTEARCLKARGIDLFIQALTAYPVTGLHQPAHRISNLRRARGAGMEIGGYFIVVPNLSGFAAFEEARRGIPLNLWEQMKIIGVDVELSGLNAYKVHDAAYAAQRETNATVAVYTNYDTWVNKLGNPQLLSDTGYPLWNASWTNREGVSFYDHPYGGWLRGPVAGEQWSGGTIICNQAVDRNIFYADMVGMMPEETDSSGDEEPEMPEMRHIVFDGRFAWAEYPVILLEQVVYFHYYLHTQNEVDHLRQRGWTVVTAREPYGKRIDW